MLTFQLLIYFRVYLVDEEGVESGYLHIIKPEDSLTSFQDGWWISLPAESRPRHVSFEFASGSKELEDTNFRLINT